MVNDTTPKVNFYVSYLLLKLSGLFGLIRLIRHTGISTGELASTGPGPGGQPQRDLLYTTVDLFTRVTACACAYSQMGTEIVACCPLSQPRFSSENLERNSRNLGAHGTKGRVKMLSTNQYSSHHAPPARWCGTLAASGTVAVCLFHYHVVLHITCTCPSLFEVDDQVGVVLFQPHERITHIIKLILGKVMTETNENHQIIYKGLYYRLLYIDIDYDLELIQAGVAQQGRDLVWWEEVEREFPHAMNASSSPNKTDRVVEDSIRLEKSNSGTESVFGDAEDEATDAGVNPGTNTDSNTGTPGPNNKKKQKKRRRISSAKTQAKKAKNAPGASTPKGPTGSQQGTGRGRTNPQSTGNQGTPSNKQSDQSRLNRLRNRDQARNQGAEEERRLARAKELELRKKRRLFQALNKKEQVPYSCRDDDLPPAVKAQLERPPSPFRSAIKPVTPAKAPSNMYEQGNEQERAQQQQRQQDPPGDQREQVDETTEQGRQREAYRQMLEANNPVASPNKNKKSQKERVPPERTFEITFRNWDPVHDEYLIPAGLLAKARKAEDRQRRLTGAEKLKLDSRLLRSGDWIVMARNDNTKEWLSEFFERQEFLNDFRATIMSMQTNLKYAVRVHPPDSAENTNEEVLSHLFQDYDDLGYVRIVNESRSYKDKDGEINKAYHKALKKRIDFDDKGTPFIKTIWIRMSAEAEERIKAEPDLLDLGIGATELEFEKAKEKQTKKKGNSNEPGPQGLGADGEDQTQSGNAEEGAMDEDVVTVMNDESSDSADDNSGAQRAANETEQE